MSGQRRPTRIFGLIGFIPFWWTFNKRPKPKPAPKRKPGGIDMSKSGFTNDRKKGG